MHEMFMRWARKANLSEAIDNLEKGLSVAELGGNLFKIRVKRAGKGKSSGFRTIVVYKKEEKQCSSTASAKMKNPILTKQNCNISKK